MRAVAVDDHPPDRVVSLSAADLTSEYRIDHRSFIFSMNVVENRFDEELLNSEHEP